jgi:hypothetical protein
MCRQKRSMEAQLEEAKARRRALDEMERDRVLSAAAAARVEQARVAEVNQWTKAVEDDVRTRLAVAEVPCRQLTQCAGRVVHPCPPIQLHNLVSAVHCGVSMTMCVSCRVELPMNQR